MSKEQILNRNRILYEVAQPLSVKTRPYDTIIQPFENQVYNQNETMLAHIPSGKYFVDPEKSYLSVKIRAVQDDNSASASFGKGSLANIVKNLRLFHRSGTTITSAQDLHLFIKGRDSVEKDDFWFETMGSMQGYSNNYTDTVISAIATQYKIKLADLHPFFRGHGSKLLSPEIVRDLRMEIDLNPVGTVLRRNTVGGLINDYEITSPELQICLVKVMDNASANVQAMSVDKGLSWSYDDVHVISKNFAGNENDIVINVDKSVSVAKHAMTLIRDEPDVTDIEKDSYNYLYLLGTQSNPTRWSYTLGNDMLPFKRKIDEQNDSYTVCIDAFVTQNGLNLSRQNYFSGDALLVTNLQTDDYLEMSGDFINANKKLEFQMSKLTQTQSQRFTTMVVYNKVLRVNSTNSRVDL